MKRTTQMTSRSKMKSLLRSTLAQQLLNPVTSLYLPQGKLWVKTSNCDRWWKRWRLNSSKKERMTKRRRKTNQHREWIRRKIRRACNISSNQLASIHPLISHAATVLLWGFTLQLIPMCIRRLSMSRKIGLWTQGCLKIELILYSSP